MARLVLLRHGQSTWNARNLFTGWYDAELSPLGEDEARDSGRLLLDGGLEVEVLHTSLQTRAIRTASLALEVAGRSWVPVRRSWRLNERHYGDLQGKDKAETAAQYGLEQVHIWRRSYDTPPPPMPEGDARSVHGDPRYADLPPEALPATECLKDVVARVVPYWLDALAPDLLAGRTVLVAAHGNSLRALVKHLDDISDEAIADLNIPTGIPLVYDLDPALRPTGPATYLDPAAAAAGAAAVAAQAGGTPTAG